MRALAALSLFSLALIGCTTDRAKECGDFVGANWSLLDAPPPNATDLLQLVKEKNSSSLVWFSSTSGSVKACSFACGTCGTRAYEFNQKDGKWAAGQESISVCGG